MKKRKLKIIVSMMTLLIIIFSFALSSNNVKAASLPKLTIIYDTIHETSTKVASSTSNQMTDQKITLTDNSSSNSYGENKTFSLYSVYAVGTKRVSEWISEGYEGGSYYKITVYTNASSVNIGDAVYSDNELKNVFLYVDSISATITATVTSDVPDCGGYTFVTWNTSKDGKGTNYKAGDEIKVTKNANDSDTAITLYAIWNVEKYDITYELDGADKFGTNPSTYNVEDKTFKISSPSKKGYTFLGWTGNYLGYTPIINPEIKTGSYGDISLIANFKANEYSIKYQMNGGVNTNPGIYSYEDSVILSAPSKKGYTFVGWTGSDIGDIPIKDVTIKKGSMGDKEYVAHWAINTNTITYDLDGGVNNPNNPDSYAVESDTFTIKEPTKLGYTFLGWSSTDSGSEIVKEPVILKGSTDDKAYKANWKLNIYSISYDLDGGKNNSLNPTTYTVCDTIKLLNPTKDGYEFIGWSGGDTINAGTVGSLTFAANWRCLHKDTYVIFKEAATIDSNGYTGDTYCNICGERVAKGRIIPKLGTDYTDTNTIKNVIDNSLPITNENVEKLADLAKDDLDAVIDIISAVNDTTNDYSNKLAVGLITLSEYQEAIEKINIIADTLIEVCSDKKEYIDNADNISNNLPESFDVDFGKTVEVFYQKQIDLLLGNTIDTKSNPIINLASRTNSNHLDLSLSKETYQNVPEFISYSVSKMTDSVLMIRNCSGEAVCKEVKMTLSVLSVKTFRDFDRAKADEEFVINAYNAILKTLQERVIAALEDSYNQKKSSGSFTGTSMDDLNKEFQEQIDACNDIETFEMMIIEVMRLKYITVFTNRFVDNQINEDAYNQAMEYSSSLETFEPIYKEIFRSWALNEESEYGITLSEISDATIETTTGKVGEEKPMLASLTTLEIKFITIFAGSFILLGLCLAIIKRRENRYERWI